MTKKMLVIGTLLYAVVFVAAESTKYGTIQGRVVDERGKPVQGAKVSVESMDCSEPKGRQLTTKPDGTFSQGGLEPGRYIVAASKTEDLYPDYSSGAFNLDVASLPQVEVSAGVTSAVGDVTLPPKGGLLFGKVTNAAGQVLLNARLRLVRSEKPSLFYETGPKEDGTFSFVLPNTPYSLQVVAPGYKGWTQPNILLIRDEKRQLDIVLDRSDSSETQRR